MDDEPLPMQEVDEESTWFANFIRQPIVWGGAILLALWSFGNSMIAARKAQASGVVWETDLAHAKVESARSNKPIFIEFGATWCGACRTMQDDVFFDPRVSPQLRRAICVHIDVDHDQDTTEAYGVQGIPRMMLLNPDLASEMDVTGSMDAAPFAQRLGQAINASYRDSPQPPQ